MKSTKFFIPFFFTLIFFNFNNLNSAIENKIIAKVDNKLISSYELENKIKTMLFLSNQELSQRNINNAKKIAVNSLINHKLKERELEKMNRDFKNPLAVNNHLEQISSKLNSNGLSLKQIFLEKNLDYNLYLEEIETEFSWQSLIFQIYGSKIDIDKNEIDEELNRYLKSRDDIEKYKLAEIEVLTNGLENEKKASEIKEQIQLIGFENTAIKFSDSSSALDGGNLGWINSKSFSSELSNIIKTLKVGEITSPIYKPNSIIFFKLIDKKKEKIDNVNLDKIKNQIFESKANEILGIFSNNYLSKLKNNAFIELK